MSLLDDLLKLAPVSDAWGVVPPPKDDVEEAVQRLNGTFGMPGPLDLLGGNMGVVRKLGESDADLRSRISSAIAPAREAEDG